VKKQQEGKRLPSLGGQISEKKVARDYLKHKAERGKGDLNNNNIGR